MNHDTRQPGSPNHCDDGQDGQDGQWVLEGEDSASGHEGSSNNASKSGAVAQIGLAEALSLWVAITGVEPGRRQSGSFTMGELGVIRLHEEIQQALELDPTELTGTMLLSYIAQCYLDDRSFTVDELLNEPAKVGAYMDKVSRLTGYLRSLEVTGPTEAFVEKLTASLKSYGALSEEVIEMVTAKGKHGDRGILAVLRRDAQLAMASLQVNQFLDGEAEEEGYRPAYGKFIYRWDNINSMLRAMVNAPSGVTVNLIQTKSNPYGVYFVFAIRNGGRIFTFTDKEWTPHPLAEGMWRRPDKILAARAKRNWFPYSLAGLQFTDEGRAYIDLPSGKSLVAYQGRGIPVTPLAELSAPQVAWISMMLDLIVEKFWHQGHREKALSYTAEMLRVADPLLAQAQQAGLPLALRSQSALCVAPVTLADVHSDNVRAEDVGDLGDQRNRWMEERYAHQVLAEAVDMTPAEGGSLLLVDFEGQSGTPGLTSSVAMQSRGSLLERARAIGKMAEVKALDATSFGTQDELQKDRVFMARANYAAQINTLAEAEFERRQGEVMAWVKERMQANTEALKPLLGNPEVLVKTSFRGQFGAAQAYGVRYFPERGLREFTRHKALDEDSRKNLYRESGRSPVILGRLPYVRSALKCHFTDSVSSYLLQVVPETAEQLAYLCGVAVKDLPDVLAHWSQSRSYVRNSILNRVDPLQSMVENPWDDMHFKLSVFVSKKAYKDLLKCAANTPWIEPASWQS